MPTVSLSSWVRSGVLALRVPWVGVELAAVDNRAFQPVRLHRGQRLFARSGADEPQGLPDFPFRQRQHRGEALP